MRVRSAFPSALAVLLALALSAAPACAAAWSPRPAALLARMAAPWPARQRADGTFRDAVLARTGPAGRDPYGTAMLGYGLLAAGLRLHDARATDAGLRALAWAIAHPVRSHKPFERLALASAYVLARDRLGADPRFGLMRPAWEARLRAMRVVRIGHAPYSNWYAVEALELLELARSGVRPDADALRRTARILFGQMLPDHLARGGILSDPPWEPLAYHAFSAALLARALQTAGPGTLGPRAPRTLTRALAASESLVSPAGDVAYIGRSDEEAWTLSMTLAALRAGGRTRLRGPILARLARDYPGRARGLGLTPSDATAPLDPYAAATSYAGLAMVGLAWALEGRRVAPPPPPRAPRSALLGGGNGAFAVVRTPSVWLAVREQPGIATPTNDEYVEDARYDAGLAAVEQRTARGWRALLPARPRTTTARAAAALTLTRHGRRGRLFGTRLALRRHGTAVLLTGAWRTWAGRSLGPARVLYRATMCGRVALRIATRRGDRVRLVLLSRTRPRAGAPVAVPGARVRVGPPQSTSTDARVFPVVYTVIARGRRLDALLPPRP